MTSTPPMKTDGDSSSAAGAGPFTGWQPISTAPRDRNVLLYTITDTELPNWKMATGCWCPGYRDEPGVWEWDGRRLRSYDTQPTHWHPLPLSPYDAARASSPPLVLNSTECCTNCGQSFSASRHFRLTGRLP